MSLISLSPYDAYNVCRENAADLIVLGLQETGITTCAANQVAATIPNLDDGNQYMKHFLNWNIVMTPDLSLRNGRLPVLKGPGLVFELDWDAISQACDLYHKKKADND